MSQYTQSDTTTDGLVVNAVLNTQSDTTTFTVTAPNGAIATFTQSSSLSGNATGNARNIAEQLSAQGYPVTRPGGLNASLSSVGAAVQDQAAAAARQAAVTNTPPPQAPAPIPVTPTVDPQVPPAPNTQSPPTTNSPAAGDPAGNEAELAQLREAEGSAIFGTAPPVDTETDGLLAEQQAIREAELAQLREAEGRAIFAPAPVLPSLAGPIGVAYDDAGNLMPGYTLDEDRNPVFVGGDFVEPSGTTESKVRGLTNQTQQQSTLQTRVTQTAAADWRVRLRLAPNATYLYRAANAGILKPLANTDGVIFPYTPSIETSYQAKYDQYDLTHSNYRGYFYKNSSVENISVKGTFTAQDTQEAEYLLAVIHFFRSVTKMFYGQDPQAGAPPPLVYLSGYGEFQFNEHPCVVSSFSYSLPNDVDYIRATGFNNIGINLSNRRTQSSGPSMGGSLGTVSAVIDRLKNAGLSKGSGHVSDEEQLAKMNQASAATAQNSVNSTYVPTKMEISITLLPMQTRNQVSKQFSLEKFAHGKLLSGGFW